MFILTFINNITIYCIGNSSKKLKTNTKMKKANYWFGVGLAIVSILTVLATYFNVAANTALIVGLCCAVFVAFVSMMQTYHYEDWHEYDPRKFWMWYVAIAVVIIVTFFFGAGVKIFDQEVALPMVYGGVIAGIPGFGVFLGFVWKTLRSECFAI